MGLELSKAKKAQQELAEKGMTPKRVMPQSRGRARSWSQLWVADPPVVVLVGHSVTFSVATSVVGLIQAPLEALQGVDGGGDAFPLSQFGRSHSVSADHTGLIMLEA